MKISAFLPVRSGSERVKHKNTRPFTDSGLSLLQVKIRQILSMTSIESVIVSTNDRVALEQVKEFQDARLVVDHRPDGLCQSWTQIRDLSIHASKVCETDMILWTHVTSPFFEAENYDAEVSKLNDQRSKGFDSLATVRPIREYVLDQNFTPVFKAEGWTNWPRTQDLDGMFAIDSAVFLAPREVFAAGARLGQKPFFSKSEGVKSFDLDSEMDWSVAQCLYGLI